MRSSYFLSIPVCLRYSWLFALAFAIALPWGRAAVLNLHLTIQGEGLIVRDPVGVDQGGGVYTYPSDTTVNLRFTSASGWCIATVTSVGPGEAFDQFTQLVQLEFLKDPAIKHDFVIPLVLDGNKNVAAVFSDAPRSPAFVQQPIHHAALLGQRVTFSSEADGIPEPTYQWQKNGTDIVDATDKNLVLSSIAAGDAASYRCIARNSVNSAVSKAAVLQIGDAVRFGLGYTQSGSGTVTFDPVGTQGDDGTIKFPDGANVAVSVQAAHGWRINSMTYASGADPNAPYDLFYQGILTKSMGGEVYTSYSSFDWIPPIFLLMDRDKAFGVKFVPLDQSAPSIGVQPADQTGRVGGDVIFSVSASGNPLPCYQWQVRTDEFTNWINLTDGNGYNCVLTPTLSISPLRGSQNGAWFRCVVFNGVSGEITSGTARLTVLGGGSADFKGVGGANDILWENPATGEHVMWFSNGSYRSWGELNLVPIEWRVAGLADFNADGQTDIVWENSVTGGRVIWMMRGPDCIGSAPLGWAPIDWSIAGAGDFNGDGSSDILWENPTTGAHVIWFLNGTTYGGWADLGFIPIEWRIVGTADFNTDGKADIVWENTSTGARVIWLMDSATCAASAELGSVSTDWHIAGTGDFNGDGRPDLLWENPATGARVIWFMNGTTYAGWADLGFVSADWHIRN